MKVGRGRERHGERVGSEGQGEGERETRGSLGNFHLDLLVIYILKIASV